MFKNMAQKKNKEFDKKNMSKDAYKISLIYAFFGGMWILFSDTILGYLLPNMEKYKYFQTIKGWFYVLVTTLLVYILIKCRAKLWNALIFLESELSYQKKLNENIIAEAPSIIITWDDDGRILSINPFGEKITGYSQDELVDGPGWPILISKEQDSKFQEIYQDIKKSDNALNYDGAIITKSGKAIDILWSSKILDSESDKGDNIYVSIGTNIEERKRYEEKIRLMAYYDPLTGLPNRFMFEQEIARRIKEEDSAFTIAYMDIDNFKNINDSLGHQAGDVFLRYFVESIIKKVEDKTFVARLGGDEFAILFNSSCHEDIMEEVGKLLSYINRIWTYQNRQFYISMSVGVVIYPEHGKDTSDLLKNADIAMYGAKREGKNRVLFYKDDLREENTKLANMINYIQEGIEQEQFYLEYQPQYRLSNKELTGMEALLRWQHPKEGYISPAEFIPIAERTGQIYRLERLVLKKALEQKMLWEKQGFTDIELAINLSTKTLTSNINFSEWEQILDSYSVDYSKIVIEITETADILNVDSVITRLSNLKKKGIKIALDDFGTGYASLNYLTKFPIDIIKLDKSFINAITKEGVDTLLIKNVLRLAYELKFNVIAEGIETKEQMQYLINYHCDLGQGYLLSKPLSEDKLLRLLENENT